MIRALESNKWMLVVLIVLLFSGTVTAQDSIAAFFKDYDAAFVLYDRSTGDVENLDPVRSAQRFAPCSTFKIYNTLIGLELGLLPEADASWYQWDGVVRNIEPWNKNLTLREAFRVSMVPAFQALARQVGAEQMEKFIKDIEYGTQDISAGVDTFWLPRPQTAPILISVDEQVALLNRLLDGKLPVSKQSVAALKDIMRLASTDRGTLYGKTGSGMDADGRWNLGWFVGFVERDDKSHVFACVITGGKDPSGKVAREIVENILKSKGLL